MESALDRSSNHTDCQSLRLDKQAIEAASKPSQYRTLREKDGGLVWYFPFYHNCSVSTVSFACLDCIALAHGSRPKQTLVFVQMYSLETALILTKTLFMFLVFNSLGLGQCRYSLSGPTWIGSGGNVTCTSL